MNYFKKFVPRCRNNTSIVEFIEKNIMFYFHKKQLCVEKSINPRICIKISLPDTELYIMHLNLALYYYKKILIIKNPVQFVMSV